MKAPEPADLMQTALALESLGMAIARGEIPDPKEIVKALSSILVTFAPVEELAPYLNDADRARIDRLFGLAAEGVLGPRPK